MFGFFPQVAATLKRYPLAANVNGRFVPGAATETPITVIDPQPAPGRDLQQLQDGDREYVHKKTWTTTEVRKGDIIEIDGTDYVVVLIPDYKTPTVGWGFDGGYHPLIREAQ
jgi:sulfur carrier protein ThiS